MLPHRAGDNKDPNMKLLLYDDGVTQQNLHLLCDLLGQLGAGGGGIGREHTVTCS